MFIKKVSAFIKSHALISKDDHIILALSGGRDSISLLHILDALKAKLKFELSAVHINHGTRGDESDNDEKFVVAICKKIAVTCTVYHLNGFTKSSSEDSLREARYQKFELESQKFENCKIATAHHLDDQLETFLMRLFKKSGPRGLLGIPEKREKYIRPLLGCSRNEIDQFCEENKILYREDLSNLNKDKLRNKIRHTLSPVLKESFGEDYIDAFYKSHAKLSSFYKEYFNANIAVFEKIVKKSKDRLEVSKSDFGAFSKHQRIHFLEYCFSLIYGLHFATKSEIIKQFNTFIDSAKTGSVFQFADNQKVLINRSQLIFFIPQKDQKKYWELYDGQIVNCGHCAISLDRIEKTDIEFTNENNIEFINGDGLSFPVKIRFWQKGDYFYPLGNKGKQKLSDFFVNQKINILEKKKILLAEADGEIIWICGYRISENRKIKKETKTFYKIEIEML